MKWSPVLKVIKVETSSFPIKMSDFVQFNSLRTKMNLYFIYIYSAINTLCLCYKTSQLMLYREIIAVCSQIHTKHINTLCGQNVELLNVKLALHRVS
jgi:hypothetical protein